MSHTIQYEDSSPVRQSVERETPREQFVRESTPAYEDRSPSPSPVSHISLETRTNLDLDTDIDMPDVPNIPYIPFEREDSMPPPSHSPTRSTHGIQREYNLPSSSPTAPTTTATSSPTRFARCSPIPSSLPKTNNNNNNNNQDQTLPLQLSTYHPTHGFIPGPPPIPDSPPLRPSKRSTRRKSAIQGSTSKIEKSRSVTLGTTKEQQLRSQSRNQSRSRKVTRAIEIEKEMEMERERERVVVQSFVLDGGGGVGGGDGGGGGGCGDGKKLVGKIGEKAKEKEKGGIRRSKRLMERD